jgi:hypothetical protein
MPGARPHGDPKKAREYRNHGRGLLALLGIWPWAHAERLGELPKTWRTDERFLDPLRAWHERACDEREQELARCRRGWREGHSVYRGWRDEHGVAHRGDLLKLPLEGAVPVEPKAVDEESRLDQLKRLGWSPEAAEAAEASQAALDAMLAEQDKRIAAFEQARAARRPVG